MRKVLCFMLICLLLPVSALADARRGDWGEEVYEIQQLLFDTGFLFEEPDGVFGKNTEAAVKWFQESWNLPVTGVVTEEDRMAIFDCWYSLCCSIALSERAAETSSIESFFYSCSGESSDAIQSYEIRRTDRGYLADISLLLGCRRIILSMTDEEVAAFAESLGDLSAWDGFSKDNPNVLDGESFRLNIAFTDGSSVTAWGSNAFPEGYPDAKSTINAFFHGLMEQYEIDEYTYD